jgi:hypothetical protein
MNVDSYKLILRGFLDAGYEARFFNEKHGDNKSIFLRHDIDFDVKYAYEMSRVEDKLNIKSTYFFLLHSKSYNLLESDNIALIKLMMSNGHHIGIHFDPTLYNDIEQGFNRERLLFENVFNIKIDCVSIHRPSEYFLNNKENICGVMHTYNPIYFSDMKYFSDSSGCFKYGHPLESEEFKNRKTIQLLTHPIWWMTTKDGSISKLNEFLESRNNKYKKHVARNCIPYKEYLDDK